MALPTAPGNTLITFDSAFFEADLARGLDKGWIITSAGFVFVMLVGLGLMEIGSIRRKHSRVVWWKILLNIINCAWWWYILGFAWAFGEAFGSFLGAETFYAGGHWVNPLQGTGERYAYITQFSHWVWRVAIACISTTIATAIVSERVTMRAVVIFNIFMNLIILPFIFAWTFAVGYLVDDIGYRDYAGCFIIFGVGATAGLVGLLFMGPRYNRYGSYPVVIPIAGGIENRPVYSSESQRAFPPSAFDKVNYQATGAAPTPLVGGVVDNSFTAANIIANRKRQDEEVYEHFGVTDYGLVCLGAIITFIGFIFFNGGASQGLAISPSYLAAERASSNTILGAMAAGLVTLIILMFVPRRKRTDRQTAVITARAFIAGMVAVASSGNVLPPWCGVLIGICGALGYHVLAVALYKSRLDDPTEFFAIFFGAGVSGIIAAAFLNLVNGIWWSNPTEGEVLLWQFLGLAILIGWTVFVALIGWGLLKILRIIRVGLKNEIVGYDYIDGARHLDYPDEPIHRLIKKKVI